MRLFKIKYFNQLTALVFKHVVNVVNQNKSTRSGLRKDHGLG